MSRRSAKYQTQRAEIVQKMAALHEKAEADQDGTLTAEQQAEWDKHKAELADVDEKIARAEELAEAERTAPARTVAEARDPQARDVRLRAERDPRRGFGSIRDFFMSVMRNAGLQAREDVEDERLRGLAVQADGGERGGARQELAYLLPVGYTPNGLRAAAGSDEHSVSDDRYGGTLVQPTFLPRLLQLGFEGDPTAGRTQDVPMSTLSLEIPARVDKNHTSSVSGGLTVGRRAEIEALSSSRMETERVRLTAHALFGLSYATEEILQFSPISFAALLEAGFRQEFASKLLAEKLFGTGADQFQGVVGAACTVAVTRTTSSVLTGRDVLNMRARCWGYQNAIWLANHDTLTSLLPAHIPLPSEATPTNIVAIYTPSLVPDRSDMLLGRPIFYTEYAETLGTKGDLTLANFSQYLEGMLTPLQSAESIHVRFLNHERSFKFWLMNAGAPWWRSALTPKESSDTLSPFVTVAA